MLEQYDIERLVWGRGSRNGRKRNARNDQRLAVLTRENEEWGVQEYWPVSRDLQGCRRC